MSFPELLAGEVLIAPGADLMYRNVHPGFYDERAGLVSSQAFTPNSDDEGCMSVSQASIVTAVDAFIDYTMIRGRQSVGVWAVSTGEVHGVGSRTVNDCERADLDPDDIPPGHAYVDFRDLGGSAGRETRRAKKLKATANARGCQYFQL